MDNEGEVRLVGGYYASHRCLLAGRLPHRQVGEADDVLAGGEERWDQPVKHSPGTRLVKDIVFLINPRIL